MMTNQKRLLKNTLLLSLSLGVMTIYGFNCSQHGFVSESVDVSSTNSVFGSTEKAKPQYGISVLSAEQLLRSMASVTGVKNITNLADQDDVLINNTFRQRSGALPVTKDLDVISGPMMVSIANLAGAVCVKMVKEEKANTNASERRFFKEFDFTLGPNAISSSGFQSTAKRLARGFWGREATAEELSDISSVMLGDFVSGAAANRTATDRTQDLANGLCVAMLSSFDAIVH